MAQCDFRLCDVATGLSDRNDGIGLCGVRRASGEAGRAERSADAGRRVNADRGPGAPDRSGPRAGGEAAVCGRAEPTQETLAAFQVIRRLLGPTRLVGYKDHLHKRR